MVAGVGGLPPLRIKDAIDAESTFEIFVELPTESLLRPYLSEDDALTALLDDDIESYYVIPADYVESGYVREYTTSPIGLGNPRISGALRTVLLQSLVGGVVTPEVAARVHQPALLDRVRLTSKGEPAPEERAVSMNGRRMVMTAWDRTMIAAAPAPASNP